MLMATPTQRSGKPTKAYQKFLGSSCEPNDDSRLPNPITVSSRPKPAMVGPTVRKTSLEVECFGSIFDFSLIELPPIWQPSRSARGNTPIPLEEPAQTAISQTLVLEMALLS